MITVRDKLLESAATQAERDLIIRWMSRDREVLGARQRVLAGADMRRAMGGIQFRW